MTESLIFYDFVISRSGAILRSCDLVRFSWFYCGLRINNCTPEGKGASSRFDAYRGVQPTIFKAFNAAFTHSLQTSSLLTHHHSTKLLRKMLEAEYYIPTPKTPTQDTTRDERLRAQTLFFDAGWSKPQIAFQLDLTLDQVKYALRNRITPQKTRSGRRPYLGPAERRQLIEWVCASRKNRRMPWNKIPEIFGWDCKVYAIETAFKKEGFGRYTAFKKLKLTDIHARIRRQWAEEHKNWTEEQWF